MIEIKDFSLRFSKQMPPFFTNLNLNLKKGLLHSLTGKNGSGKTTFLNALRGELACDTHVEGSILLDGQPYNLKERKELQKAIALVPQKFDSMIADKFTFQENLHFAQLDRCPHPLKAFKKQLNLPNFIERFGIQQNMPVRQLSGGQRQILALLMALQKNPSVILLDEPTATLDTTNAHMVFKFICELVLEQSLTVLVISHDHDLLKEYRSGSALELIVAPDNSRKLHSP